MTLITKHRKMLIPPIAFVGAAYILAFPLPILLPNLYLEIWNKIPPHALEYAILWAVRGFSTFALGYVFVEQFGPRLKSLGLQSDSFSKEHINYTIYILTNIGWLAILAWISSAILFGISLSFIEQNSENVDLNEGTLAQIFTLLSDLRYPFFLGFLLLYYWKKSNQHLFYIFIGLLVISIIEAIIIGSKGSIIRGLVVGSLTLSFLPIRLKLKYTVIGLLVLLMAYSSFTIITEYRSIMRNELQFGRNIFDFTVQLESFEAALINSLPFTKSINDRQTEVGHADILSRFGSGIFSFANLLDMTDRQSPYEHALETFLVPFYSIVPRAILPNKPEFFHSGRNAQEYYGWTYGGISVTLLGSLYFSWGYEGILCGMGLIGALLAYAIKRVGVEGLHSPFWLIILSTLLISILDVGVIFQAIITNIIRIAILLLIIHLLYPRASKLRR